MTSYPELDKLLAVKDESQKLGEFLDWLKGKVVLCEWVDNEDDDTNAYMPEILYPVYKYNGDYGTQRLLAEYFDIDLEKVEAERLEVIKSFR